jgi:hypothetical protein
MSALVQTGSSMQRLQTFRQLRLNNQILTSPDCLNNLPAGFHKTPHPSPHWTSIALIIFGNRRQLMPRLTDQEQQEIIRLIENACQARESWRSRWWIFSETIQ